MGSTFCCLGTQSCLCCSSLLSEGNGIERKLFHRIAYIIFSFIFISILLIFVYFGSPIVEFFHLTTFFTCPITTDADANNLNCIGLSTLFRVSFILSIFHLIFAFLCLCGGPIISAINEGAWLLKLIIVSLGIIGSLFISNNIIKYFSIVCVVGSCIFQIFEVILLISLAYKWNDNWVKNYDSTQIESTSEKIWACLLIFFTILFYSISIFSVVLIFKYFEVSQIDFLFIIICLSLNFLNTIIIFTKCVRGASLFTTSIVFLFSIFLSWNALLSNPQHVNNYDNSITSVLQVAIGISFMVLILLYIASASNDLDTGKNREESIISKTNEALIEKNEDSRIYYSSNDNSLVSLQSSFFHILLLLASMSYPMILMNLDKFKINNLSDNYFSINNNVSYILKFSSMIFGLILYSWSLLSSIICRCCY